MSVGTEAEGLLPIAACELSAVRVLLCDADGNLFPSEEPAFEASAVVTNAFLAAFGVPVELAPEELRLATTGRNFRTTAVDLCVRYGVPVDASLVGGRTGARTPSAGGRPALTPAVLDEWVVEEQRRVSAHLADVLRPDPSVLEPLRRLHGSLPLAAVSSSACARLDACFTATGLAGLIPAARRYSAEDSLPRPTSKPDPAIYAFACQVLGIQPHEGLAVEDSVPGAQSAVAAGCPTVGNVMFVADGERAARVEALRAAGVSAIVTSWDEIADVLTGVMPGARGAAGASLGRGRR